MKHRSKKFAGLVLFVLGSVALSSCSRKVTATQGEDAVPVVVTKVLQKDIPVQVRSIGNAQPYSTVLVRAEVTGQLTGVFFKEGQNVKKGDLLFTLDRRPLEAMLEQSEANLARDQVQLQNAGAQAKRYTDLQREGVVSKEQYDQIQANAKALESTVRADQAVVQNVKLQLQYCSIYSPVDGRTGNLLANQGNLVTANSTQLVVINQIQPIYVTFAVPESSLPEIQQYQSRGELKVEAAIPNGPPAEGELTFVDNAVDPMTGTIKLRGTFQNTDNRIWPGQFVDIVLTITIKPGAIVVPSQAVQTGQQGQFVFVVKGDGTAETRPVTIDTSANGLTVIAKGLAVGDSVVTDGQSRLMSGSKVELKAATQPDGQTR